jgi:hypothetical protein
MDDGDDDRKYAEGDGGATSSLSSSLDDQPCRARLSTPGIASAASLRFRFIGARDVPRTEEPAQR